MNPPALIVIDVQKGLDHPSFGNRNNPQAESNIATLLRFWREKELPLVHIRHCSTESNSSLGQESPGNAYKEEAIPLAGEIEFTKNVNSAFIGTGLEQHLHDLNISNLVIVGLTTDHCVSTSVRMAENLGFKVTLVADATAAFGHDGVDGNYIDAEIVHAVNLASLNGEFCEVKNTEDIIQQLNDF